MIKFDISGSSLECFAVIKDLTQRTSAKGGEYLDMNLTNKTGTINAKLWDYSSLVHGVFTAGDLVKVRGVLSQFNGQDQLKIERIRLVNDNDNIDPADYVKSADFSSEDMFNALYNIANNFNDNNLKLITTTILNEKKEKLLIWPAAFKLHHAIRGGLLYHTLSVVRLCEAVSSVYPFIDKDLLLAGAILHDVCKTEELAANESGISTGYTLEGNLLGHLTKGANLVESTAKKLGINNEVVTLLMHMMLSHHGVPEYGSPVLPQFLEAILLNQLDNIDATAYEVLEEVENVPAGEFTGKVFCLDGRKLYNHARKDRKKPNIL